MRQAMTGEELSQLYKMDHIKRKAKAGKITEDDLAFVKALPNIEQQKFFRRYPDLEVSGRSRRPKARKGIVSQVDTQPGRTTSMQSLQRVGSSGEHGYGPSLRVQSSSNAKQVSQPWHGGTESERAQLLSSEYDISHALSSIQSSSHSHEGSTLDSHHSSTGSHDPPSSPNYDALWDAVEDEHMFDEFESIHEAHSHSPTHSQASVNQH